MVEDPGIEPDEAPQVRVPLEQRARTLIHDHWGSKNSALVARHALDKFAADYTFQT